MVLRGRLLSVATARPHVLLVSVPGHRAVRWAAERFLVAAGWPTAASPAEADVLLVCGDPGDELGPLVEVAWNALPGPRALATATRPEDVEAALLAAQAGLRDEDAQRADVRERPAPPLGAAGGMDHGSASEGMDHGSMDHGSGHEGHSMHDMAMDLPGGLSMADRAVDRDGLKLDVLHLSWGPILPSWPAGLQLDLVLQGDVLQQVTARVLDPAPDPPEDSRRVALDDLAAVLDAAGWYEGTTRARRLRDGELSEPELAAFARRVGHARLLHWSLRSLPAPGGHDVPAYLQHLLGVAAGEQEQVRATQEELERDLAGLDLGTAAIVVAAYGSSVREEAVARA